MPLQTHGRRRWRIAALLAMGVLVNYIDRINLSVAHAALITTFSISDITYGWMLSAYNITYALCQLPAGFLLDKLGVRRIGALSAATVCAASLGAAVAPGVPSFFAARFLLGIGESPLFPGNGKAIGHWFPPRERSFSTSLFDSAAKLASAIGVPLTGVLLLHVGWRWSFACTGFLTLGYFVLFTRIYREPEDDPQLSPDELQHICAREPADRDHEDEATLPFAKMFLQPRIVGVALGMLSYNFTFYLLFTWLPTYFARALHVDLLHSFLYTGVPWLIATATDLFVGGWLVDALIRRGAHPGKLRMRIVVAGLLCGLGIIGAAPAHTAGQALFWITLSVAGLSAGAPVMWTAPALIAPRRNVAMVGSFANLCGQVGGISAPILTGYVVTRTHSFSAAFITAAVLLLLGVAAYVGLVRTIEPIELVSTSEPAPVRLR